MERGVLLDGLVCLAEGRITDIEEHGTETIGDALVTGKKSIDCKRLWSYSVGREILVGGVINCWQHLDVLLLLHLSDLQHYKYVTGIYNPPSLYTIPTNRKIS